MEELIKYLTEMMNEGYSLHSSNINIVTDEYQNKNSKFSNEGKKIIEIKIKLSKWKQ